MEKYEKKKEYNANWTQENTKNVTIRFKRDDEIWEMIEVLKSKGIKMNALFKDAVIEEMKKYEIETN